MTLPRRNEVALVLAPSAPDMLDWIRRTMKLITAHKILISSAAVFFCFFAGWEFRNYSTSGEIWAVARSALYLAVAIGFAVYLKNLRHLYKLK